jgi:predicted nucleic acid-binding protein
VISSVVLDTDVISFLFKHDTRAEDYRKHLDGKLLMISFMTLAELYRWTIERNWGDRRKSEFAEFLRPFTVIEVNQALCLKWAEITTSARRKGQQIETADAWVAATALLYNLPLVTHNRNDYRGVDSLQVISEAP